MAVRRRKHKYPDIEIIFKKDNTKEIVQLLGFSSTGKSLHLIRNGKIEYILLSRIKYREL
ncbi:MAG: hypothetical protein QM503_06600 [Bacteroidota bacterium]